MDILNEPWYDDCVALANEIMEPGRSYIKEDLQFLIEEKLNIDYRKAEMVLNTLVSEYVVYHVPGTDFYKIPSFDRFKPYVRTNDSVKRNEIELKRTEFILPISDQINIKDHLDYLYSLKLVQKKFSKKSLDEQKILERIEKSINHFLNIMKNGPVGVIANE